MADPAMLKSLMGMLPCSPEETARAHAAIDYMTGVKARATRSDGSLDVAAIAAGFQAVGLPARLTSKGLLDISSDAFPFVKEDEELSHVETSDSFYTPLANGDREASDGALYRLQDTNDDPSLVFTNGGRISPGGRIYRTVSLAEAISKNDLKTVTRLLKNDLDIQGRTPNGRATLFARAVQLGYGPIANAICHTWGCYPLVKDCMNYVGHMGSLYPLHVVAAGGKHLKENMESLMRSSYGLIALQTKDGTGKLPEEVVSDEELRTRMKFLREGYTLFLDKLRVNISKDLGLLNMLMPIATHITSVSSDAGKFPDLEVKKAGRILTDLETATTTAHALAEVIPLEAAVDELSSYIGKLKATPVKDKKNLDAFSAQIQALCSELTSRYGIAKALSLGVPSVISSLERKMRMVRTKGNAVVAATIDALLPTDAAVLDTATGHVERDITSSGEFDILTADLDVETLAASMKAPKSQQPTFLSILQAKVKDAESRAIARKEACSTNMSDKAIKRFAEKIKHAIAYTSMNADVKKVLETAVSRGLSYRFIWSVLRFSEDPRLQKAFSDLNALTLSDRDTVVTGSVCGSLATPGGKLRSHDDDGSVVGSTVAGTVGGYGRLAEVEEPDEGEAAPIEERYILPCLSSNDKETMWKLFKKEYTSLAEDGSEILRLFNNLGPDFKASSDKGKLKASFRSRTTGTHAKHKGVTYEGINPEFANDCCDLLRTAGIEEQDLIRIQSDEAASGGAV